VSSVPWRPKRVGKQESKVSTPCGMGMGGGAVGRWGGGARNARKRVKKRQGKQESVPTNASQESVTPRCWGQGRQARVSLKRVAARTFDPDT
jgi:hypothetical protein